MRPREKLLVPGPVSAQPSSIRYMLAAARPRWDPIVGSGLQEATERLPAQELADAARALDIGPLIATHLHADPELADCELASLLHPDRLSALAASIFRHEVYGRVSRALSSAAIPHAPLKGQDLAERVYASVEARTMVDVDLLVPEEEYPRAAELIAGLPGFRKEADDRPLGAWTTAAKDLHFVGSIGAQGLSIELHRRLGHRHHIRCDYGSVFRRSLPSEQGTQRYLSAEDVLLLTAYHLARSMLPSRLLWLVDLLGIVRVLRPDWDLVCSRARSWGFGAGLWLCLRRGQTILGEEFACPAVLADLRPRRLQRAYLDALLPPATLLSPLDHQGVRTTQALLWLPLMDDWRSRVRFAAHYGWLRVRQALHMQGRGA